MVSGFNQTEIPYAPTQMTVTVTSGTITTASPGLPHRRNGNGECEPRSTVLVANRQNDEVESVWKVEPKESVLLAFAVQLPERSAFDGASFEP